MPGRSSRPGFDVNALVRLRPAACGFVLRTTPAQDAGTNNNLSHRLRLLFGGSPGARTRRRQRSWLKAHPKEEPMNHSLAVGRHRALRARVTRDHRIKSPRPATLKPLIFSVFDFCPSPILSCPQEGQTKAAEPTHPTDKDPMKPIPGILCQHNATTRTMAPM